MSRASEGLCQRACICGKAVQAGYARTVWLVCVIAGPVFEFASRVPGSWLSECVESEHVSMSFVGSLGVLLRASARSLVVGISASARGATLSRFRFVFSAFASGKVGACRASSVARLCVRVLGAGARSPRAGSSVGLGRRGPGAAARDLWGSGDGRRQAAAREREERVAHHNNRENN